jgi:hypothetical protein
MIRRDNVEKLLLVGGGADVVVEPNIVGSTNPGDVKPAPARAGCRREIGAARRDPNPARSLLLASSRNSLACWGQGNRADPQNVRFHANGSKVGPRKPFPAPAAC